MNWKSFVASATRERLDELESLLWGAGAVSVTVEDGGENPLFEPGPGEIPIWDDVVVTGLFEEEANAEEIRQLISQHGFAVLLVDEVKDRDWEREWLIRFRPMQFGRRLWVCPTGFEVNAPGAVVMKLDPGLAFGTGTHATTSLCLQWLDQHQTGAPRVIDYGCGSGILGIGALLLGASEVLGVDNDPQALTATRDNAERNDVASRLVCQLPSDVTASRYDIVIANILAQPLIDLSIKLVDFMAPGAALVLSGIMVSQAEWVMKAYPQIRFDEPAIFDGWVRLSGRHR